MSRRIVIAEDGADIRINLNLLKTLEDCEICATPNGREALQLARRPRASDRGRAARRHVGAAGHCVVHNYAVEPQVLAKDGKLLGFEAPMRWLHSELGLVTAVRAIPIAKGNGQIVPLGTWALQEARWQTRQWQNHRPVGSAPSGLDASRLELESTESTAMLDLQPKLAVLDPA
jgi:EAL domain-containing protein (putative c-di-GMP-specific phosphodiesterase class I)